MASVNNHTRTGSWGTVSFKAGSVDFEVYAFDMQENKELGMVKGSAQSSKSVIARTNHTENTDQDLKRSMAMNAGVAYGMLLTPFEEK